MSRPGRRSPTTVDRMRFPLTRLNVSRSKGNDWGPITCQKGRKWRFLMGWEPINEPGGCRIARKYARDFTRKLALNGAFDAIRQLRDGSHRKHPGCH